MRKNLRTAAIVATASAGLVLLPAGIAYAAGNGNGNSSGPHGTGDRTGTCTHDQQQDRLHLKDGTGPRHAVQTSTATTGHRSGRADGNGPQAVRPLDGTGNRWGRYV